MQAKCRWWAGPGLLKLTRKLLVGAGHQCGAVPHPPVGIGLERRRERLVDAVTLPQAGALPDRGPNQRMTKTDRVDIDVDQRRPNGRLQRVEVISVPATALAA